MHFKKLYIFFLNSLLIYWGPTLAHVIKDNVSHHKEDNVCQDIVDPATLQEIKSYKEDVGKILSSVADNGIYRGYTYDSLATFIDKFGPRMAGTEALERSIDYMLNLLREENFTKVYYEKAKVPKWTRGKESCQLVLPRKANLNMLGLGGTVGTPMTGITAEAIVVSSFEELRTMAQLVKGKIVVYNENFTSYGGSVIYRRNGAIEAAKLGAVASLIRSITPFSMNTPHTGTLAYDPNVTEIPGAAITVEDAHMLHRMYLRGEKIVIHLYMEGKRDGFTISRNTIAEVRGNKYPQQKVIVSGHLDSWDVGQGAMDDGGGAFISWNAIALISKLGLQTKRTLRAILWTGEEQGLWGASAYFKQHKEDIPYMNILMESDGGTFKARGLAVAANNESYCIIEEILKMLSPISANEILRDSQPGPDIGLWAGTGVPLAGLYNAAENYFWYHHSNADTMEIENPINLDEGTAVFAAVSYVLGNLERMLPR